jgi:hypothetical protein
MTVHELLTRMSSREFAEWKVLNKIEIDERQAAEQRKRHRR